MKIGYFADGPWSHLAIEKLLQNGHEISFIVPRFDVRDPILKSWSEKLQVPFLPAENVNDPSFLKSLEPYQADVFISMSFNQILRKDIIHFAPKGFINCHAGMLPFYRGRNPLNWALINGESSIGVTTHYVDEGIDTGDIITQEVIPVTLNDTYGTLLEKAIAACPVSLCKAVKMLESGNFTPIKQETIHPVGTYFSQRRNGDELIDWNWSSERIYNFVRAITIPGPGARTFVDGEQEIAILACELIDNAPNYISHEGEVVGRQPIGVIVKTGDSTLLISLIKDIETGLDQIPTLRIGTRFTNKNMKN